MTDELRAALERLSQLHAELQGSGGNDRVTVRTLKRQFEEQASAVVTAYREQKFAGAA